MMIFRLLMMPMMPAMAMPPMPMLLAYWKICSALAVAAVVPSATATSGKSQAMAGMMTHQTATDPQQMMRAYFSPTM